MNNYAPNVSSGSRLELLQTDQVSDYSIINGWPVKWSVDRDSGRHVCVSVCTQRARVLNGKHNELTTLLLGVITALQNSEDKDGLPICACSECKREQKKETLLPVIQTQHYTALSPHGQYSAACIRNGFICNAIILPSLSSTVLLAEQRRSIPVLLLRMHSFWYCDNFVCSITHTNTHSQTHQKKYLLLSCIFVSFILLLSSPIFIVACAMWHSAERRKRNCVEKMLQTAHARRACVCLRVCAGGGELLLVEQAHRVCCHFLCRLRIFSGQRYDAETILIISQCVFPIVRINVASVCMFPLSFEWNFVYCLAFAVHVWPLRRKPGCTAYTYAASAGTKNYTANCMCAGVSVCFSSTIWCPFRQ